VTRQKTRQLLTVRQIQDEYGLPRATAESLMRALARDGKLVRIDGVRRVFAERDEIEARIHYTSG